MTTATTKIFNENGEILVNMLKSLKRFGKLK